jgi:hypothetical protein
LAPLENVHVRLNSAHSSYCSQEADMPATEEDCVESIQAEIVEDQYIHELPIPPIDYWFLR